MAQFVVTFGFKTPLHVLVEHNGMKTGFIEPRRLGGRRMAVLGGKRGAWRSLLGGTALASTFVCGAH